MNRRPLLPSRRRSGQAAVLVAIAALVAPETAGAHIRSGIVAVDYRASVRQPSKLLVYQGQQFGGRSGVPASSVVEQAS